MIKLEGEWTSKEAMKCCEAWEVYRDEIAAKFDFNRTMTDHEWRIQNKKYLAEIEPVEKVICELRASYWRPILVLPEDHPSIIQMKIEANS